MLVSALEKKPERKIRTIKNKDNDIMDESFKVFSWGVSLGLYGV